MTLRCARRCAYDLSHAVSSIPMDDPMRIIYEVRSKQWVELFQSGNAMKDYRLELHAEIEKRECALNDWSKLLKEHKIPHVPWEFND